MEKKKHKKYYHKKQKQTHGIGVTIPEFGETYEINGIENKIERTHKIERKQNKTLRTEIVERLEKLKEEIKDMDNYVRQDIEDKGLRDEDIFRINEKIKDLEKQILNVIEGQGHCGGHSGTGTVYPNGVILGQAPSSPPFLDIQVTGYFF